MISTSERLIRCAEAYEKHAVDCPICSNTEDSLLLCDTGSALMQDFYDALQASALYDRGVDKDN